MNYLKIFCNVNNMKEMYGRIFRYKKCASEYCPKNITTKSNNNSYIGMLFEIGNNSTCVAVINNEHPMSIFSTNSKSESLRFMCYNFIDTLTYKYYDFAKTLSLDFKNVHSEITNNHIIKLKRKYKNNNKIDNIEIYCSRKKSYISINDEIVYATILLKKNKQKG